MQVCNKQFIRTERLSFVVIRTLNKLTDCVRTLMLRFLHAKYRLHAG